MRSGSRWRKELNRENNKPYNTGRKWKWNLIKIAQDRLPAGTGATGKQRLGQNSVVKSISGELTKRLVSTEVVDVERKKPSLRKSLDNAIAVETFQMCVLWVCLTHWRSQVCFGHYPTTKKWCPTWVDVLPNCTSFTKRKELLSERTHKGQDQTIYF